jgi:type II secretory pathway component PulF
MNKIFYVYKALKSDHTIIKDFCYIQDKKELYELLKKKNLKLIKAHKPFFIKFFFFEKYFLVVLKEWFYFLFYLSKNEFALIDSLKMLTFQTKSIYLKSILYKIIDDLENGFSLSDALCQQKNIFNKLIIHTIKTAEKTGNINDAFKHLNEYLSWKINFREKIIQSLRYPLFMLLFISFIGITLNIYFVPELVLFLKDNPTDSLSLSMWFWFQENIYVLFLIFFFMGFIIFSLLKSICFIPESYAIRMFKFIYRLPILNFYYRLNILRSLKTLCLVLESNLNLKEALAFSKEEITIPYLSKLFNKIEENLLNGKSFSSSLSFIPLIDPMIIRFVELGEKTGEYAKHLNLCMNHIHETIQNNLEKNIKLLQPSFILLTGVLLLWMVTAFLTPIYNHFPGFVS